MPKAISCAGAWDIWNPYGWLNAAPPMAECMALNEFGFFLAVAFAPLAFLWLAIAVFLQSAELKEQRSAQVAQLEEAAQHLVLFLAEQVTKRRRELINKVRLKLYDVGEPQHRDIEVTSLR
ncbi:hypothetical protein [Roseibium sp.]